MRSWTAPVNELGVVVRIEHVLIHVPFESFQPSHSPANANNPTSSTSKQNAVSAMGNVRGIARRRCLEARNDVQYLFNSARSSAQSENDPDKKLYANQLMIYWEEGTKRHEEEIKKAKEVIEHCDKCKSGDI
jgi:hypothetical protein